MGNLHEGHLSLVRIARERNAVGERDAEGERDGVVVASIFVNPLQFAPHEDFDKYPRTMERDCELLAAGGCDMVFAPSEQEVYPEPQGYKVQPPAGLADILEGQVRPGFFVGVCTVVLKLFNMVQPTAAVFGKKDYQQLLVIKSLVQQLALPIEIVPAETVRESSGLALSSRNGYLSDTQRVEAAELSTVLNGVAAALKANRTDWKSLEREATDALSGRGWRPDYVAIRNQTDLLPPTPGVPAAGGTDLVVLGAAKLAGTRLIDNVEVRAALRC
jgi:pantoate--beta-alanine ligase